MPGGLRGLLQQEVEKILELGVIEDFHRPSFSIPVLVSKQVGSICFCIDRRQLNVISAFDTCAVPWIDALLHQVGQSRFLSTLDLSKGYWQIPIWQEDKEKTAFPCPSGSYHYSQTPFVVCGVAETFQRLMDRVLQPVADFTVAFTDNILIFSNSWPDHLLNLRQVLQLLQKAVLMATPANAIWADPYEISGIYGK